MHFKFMLITLIFTGNIQQAYSCSPGPEIPPTPFDTVNEFKEADQVLFTKVIEVQKAPSVKEKFEIRHAKTVKKNNTRIAYFKTRVEALNKTTDFSNEIKDIKLKKRKLEESYRYIVRDLEIKDSKIRKNYLKDTIDNSLDKKLTIDRQKIIEAILTNKMQQLKLENQLKIISLRKNYSKQLIRNLNSEINSLQRENNDKSFIYDGPITVKMKVIESYKGKNKAGEVISFHSKEKPFNDCYLDFYDHYLYNAEEGRYALLNYNGNRVYSWRSILFTSKGKDNTVAKMHKIMKKVKSGDFRDKVISPKPKPINTKSVINSEIPGRPTVIFNNLTK